MDNSNPFAFLGTPTDKSVARVDVVSRADIDNFRELTAGIVVLFDRLREWMRAANALSDPDRCLRCPRVDGAQQGVRHAVKFLHISPRMTHGSIRYVLAMADIACKVVDWTHTRPVRDIRSCWLNESDLDGTIEAACYPERFANLIEPFWLAVFFVCMHTIPSEVTQHRIALLADLYNIPVVDAPPPTPGAGSVHAWLEAHVGGESFGAAYLSGAPEWMYSGMMPVGFRETSQGDSHASGLFLTTTSMASVARRSLSTAQYTAYERLTRMTPRGPERSKMSALHLDLWYMRAFATRYEQDCSRGKDTGAKHASFHAPERLSFLDHVITSTDILRRSRDMAFEYAPVENHTPFIVQIGKQWAVRHAVQFELCTSLAHAIQRWFTVAGPGWSLPSWLAERA